MVERNLIMKRIMTTPAKSFAITDHDLRAS